jgi:hypothetical protein
MLDKFLTLNKAEKTILSIVIVCIIPCFCVATAALMISEQNTNTTCGTPFIKQTVWLTIYAYYLICSNTIMAFAIALVLYLTYKYKHEDETGEAALTLIIYNMYFYRLLVGLGTFSFIWNIIGSVILFRDSMECVEVSPYLWIIFLICLILHWNGILLGCCYKRKTRADGYIEIV